MTPFQPAAIPSSKGVPINILLVEDNAGDVRLTQESLAEARVANELFVVTDGVEALDFLRRKGQYRQAPAPDLVLLDLNLPKKNGQEVLAEIKSDPALKRVPVIVLTSSKAEQDIVASYDLHANAYVTKPVDLGQFLTAIQAIQDFWLTVVRLPSSAEALVS